MCIRDRFWKFQNLGPQGPSKMLSFPRKHPHGFSVLQGFPILGWSLHFLVSHPYIVYHLVSPPFSTRPLSVSTSHYLVPPISVPVLGGIQHSPFLSYSTKHRHSILYTLLETASRLLHIHVSKACIILSSCFLNVQVSAPYIEARSKQNFTTFFLSFMSYGLFSKIEFWVSNYF